MADKTRPETEDTPETEAKDPVQPSSEDALPADNALGEPEVLSGDIVEPGQGDPPEIWTAEVIDPEAEPGAGGGEAEAGAPSDMPQVAASTAEPSSATPPKPAEQPAPITPAPALRRGGFVPGVLGGVIAAGLGLVALESGALDQALGRVDPMDAILDNATAGAENAVKIADLTAQIAAFSQPELTPYESRLTALEAAQAAAPEGQAELAGQLEALTADLAALQGQVEAFTALQAQVAGLAAQADALAARPIAGDLPDEVIAALTTRIEAQSAETEAALEAARADFAAEVEALTTLIDESRGYVETMVADARAAEASAAKQAAQASGIVALQADLAALQAALESGAPFDDAAARLTDGGIALPEALTVVAADGVTPLAVLIDSYPAAARAALAATRDTSGGGLTGFLQKQLGARSVTPRDGEDPDAILSRAEAAATQGRLSDALTELATLPEAGQAEMADWMARAQARQAALDAVGDISAAMTLN